MDDNQLRIYNSAQFHWHSPAEHQIDSTVYDLELHVVHTVVEDGVTKYGVAGFFFKVDNNVHRDIFDRYDFISGNLRPFAFPINVRNRLAYHYEGSLTAPPCI
jgi:carbonic anhydrase